MIKTRPLAHISPYVLLATGYSTPAFLKLLAALLIIISSFSCNSTSRPRHIKEDSTLIKLPAPPSLSKEEALRLNNICRYWYDSVLKPGNFNGGILVASKGNIIFEEYKGTTHLGSIDTISSHTPLHVASVTKTFTAMAILKLAEEGRINVNDSLTKYFPAFNYPGVTIKTLLNHRSGLPNYLYFMEDLGWDKSQYIKNEDVLDHLIRYKDKIKNIGSADRNFNYCNTNYVLLALIIEKASGETFPDYMRKTFFEPLSMNNSYVFTLKDTGRMSPSYDWRGREIPINFLDVAYGDKNIYTTPRDLLKWDRALAADIIFRKSTLDSAYIPYSNERPGIKNYGLGWRMNVYPTGKKMIFHNGWWHGSNAVFIRLLKEDATIIVVGNRYTNAIYKARHLANVFDNYTDENSDEDEVTTPDTFVLKP